MKGDGNAYIRVAFLGFFPPPNFDMFSRNSFATSRRIAESTNPRVGTMAEHHVTVIFDQDKDVYIFRFETQVSARSDQRSAGLTLTVNVRSRPVTARQ